MVEKKITTIPSTGEEIVINNSSYYSYVINTTSKLSSVVDACVADDTTQISKLEKEFSNIILMNKIDSHFLRETDNMFDVRLAEQLKHIVDAEPSELFGLILFTPSGNGEKGKIDNKDLENAAKIVWPNTEEDIIANEIGGTSKLNFDIKNDGAGNRYIQLKLIPSNDIDIKSRLFIPFTIDPTMVGNDTTPAYTINKNKFTIEITYQKKQDSHGEYQTDTINTYIHYNTIIFVKRQIDALTLVK